MGTLPIIGGWFSNVIINWGLVPKHYQLLGVGSQTLPIFGGGSLMGTVCAPLGFANSIEIGEANARVGD